MTEIAALMAAAFLGAGVQAATGFGFALIAAPVFLATMNSLAAMQLLVVIHLWQSLIAVPGLARTARRDLLPALMAGAALGFPLGLWLFHALDVGTLKLGVGVTILAFTALLAAREAGWLEALSRLGETGAARSAPLLAATGLGSGFLTAVLVMSGPPLILHLAALRLGKDESRALSLTFFAFCYLAVTALHALTGGVPERIWRDAVLLAPAVIAGTLAGTHLAGRLSEQRFRWSVLALLMVSGVVVVATSL